MKVSLNWLREFVELPVSVEELTDTLTRAGVEVEHVHTRGAAIDKVVVAQIVESAPHPNADRLSVCRVNDGSETAWQIVCGAKNYAVGDKVPLALPGAVLPGDFKIKVGKLRGVESQGMLCSAKELGLAEDAAGLLILDPVARVGAPISELFPADTVLEVEITPNRPDLLSHIGMAREIAALTGRTFAVVRSPAEPTTDAHIRLEAPELCPFYSATIITGVRVAPSPEWLRLRLETIGLRAINNIVDITNFVMLEMGQPLHAFDLAHVRGDIRVRAAAEKEKFLALDGRTYELTPQCLLIADEARALAIGGVMGGEESGVTTNTRDVLLESAWFSPANIRRTSRALALASDSSYRFERGVDSENVLPAARRAAELIAEIGGGEVEEIRAAGTLPQLSRIVPLRANRVSEVLGAPVSAEREETILTGLGLRREGGGWRVPSFRGNDLTREIDLVEEIVRVVGIENVSPRESGRFVPSSNTDRAHDVFQKLRQTLVARGFYEARNVSLVPAPPHGLEYTRVALEGLRRLRNPMIDDQVVLRPNLLHGLLRNLQHNARAGEQSVRLFELGRVYSASQQPEESTHLGIVATGPVEKVSWRNAKGRLIDLFDLKAIFHDERLTFTPDQNPALALALTINFEGKRIGFAGQLWPAAARGFDVASPVVFAELGLAAFLQTSRSSYLAFSRYPAVTRDIALLVPTKVSHEKITRELHDAAEPLLAQIELFDVFAGDKVPAGQKSMAYTLTYRAGDRTLSSDEVNAAHAKLKRRLADGVGAVFRE